MIITAPDRMSALNAFYALWQGTDVEEVFQEKTHLLNEVKDEVSTPEKGCKIDQKNPWIFYAAGKKVFVDFGKYPKMDVTGYDSIHGEGSAERRLNSYQAPTFCKTLQ